MPQLHKALTSVALPSRLLALSVAMAVHALEVRPATKCDCVQPQYSLDGPTLASSSAMTAETRPTLVCRTPCQPHLRIVLRAATVRRALRCDQNATEYVERVWTAEPCRCRRRCAVPPQRPTARAKAGLRSALAGTCTGGTQPWRVSIRRPIRSHTVRSGRAYLGEVTLRRTCTGVRLSNGPPSEPHRGGDSRVGSTSGLGAKTVTPRSSSSLLSRHSGE
jgi:hypothetical protein